MILVSLGLLLLSAVQTNPVKELIVIAWLASLVMVGLRNIGAALGIYVGAVALFSGHHSVGKISVFDRPDHAALFVLLVEMGLFRMRRRGWFSVDWLALVACGFLAYGLVNGFLTGTFAMWKMEHFARMFGIPFVLALVALRARPTPKDVLSFLLAVSIVAGYSAWLSILWVADLRELIFPTWINDPLLAESSRAGGIIMHPGHNGKLLGLVFAIVVLLYRHWIKGPGRLLLVALGAALLLGVYFSYSRGAYLGTSIVILILFWQSSGRGRRTALKRALLMGSVAIGLSAAVLSPPAMLKSRVTKEETILWRFEVWKIAVRMVPKRPLFGYGFNAYSDNAADFFEGSDILKLENLESGAPAVHNTFLNIIIEFGMVGFSLYIATLYFLFRRAALSAHRLWGREGVAWVVVFLMAYLIPGQFSVAHEPTGNLVLFCTPALLGGMVVRRRYADALSNGMRAFPGAPPAGRFELRAS